MRKKPLIRILRDLEVEIVSTTPNGGGWIPCKCPLAPFLHEKGIDTNASFFVKVDDKKLSGWHCFTCKEKSSRLATLARKLAYYREENLSELEMECNLEETPDEFPNFEDDDLDEEIASMPIDISVYGNMYDLAWEAKACRNYLKQRGISERTADEIGLMYDPDEKRVLFPIKDQAQQLFGFSGRTILEPRNYPFQNYSRMRDYSYKKERHLLGEYLITPGRPLFLVEGMFGFANLVEIGARHLVNPVASLGSVLTDWQKDKIVDIGYPVFLCYDDDLAGDVGMFGLRDKAGKHKGGGAIDMLRKEVVTMLALYPEDVDDVDDFTIEDVQKIVARDHELM